MGSTCIIMQKYSDPCTPQTLENIAYDSERKFHVPECAFHEVYPNIIIGGESSALDKGLLRRLKVTHVVNCAQGQQYGHVDSDEAYYQDTNIKFYAIQASDELGFNIAPYLEPTAKFIDQSMKEGGRLFVHCCMGFCRAPTVVISYLMIHQGMDVREALTLVRSKRVVCPNQSFREQLCELNERLRKSQL
ncbi:dual specificity protein phosphatase 3-like [Amphiura filiformis]|uniref:dual specificity protein phosphatase 3-like n=1 Tax=Amphiura filiformis TaxID=82378 RepID=UPI003B21BD86